MIFKKIIAIKNNNLARSSLIVFVGTFIGGVGGYLYNMIMGRMLGPESYGVLASLASLFYILGVPSGTLSVVVSQSIAGLSAKGELAQTRYFIDRINKLFIMAGAVIFVLFIFVSPFIANFLNIASVTPVVILGSIFGISFLGAVNMAALQGLRRFFHFSLNGILSSALKLFLGVAFVWIGWGVNGALGAMAIASALTIWHAYSNLNLPKKSSATEIDTASMIEYAKPVFLATLAAAALYNIDVILVKHYFEPTIAGYYGVLSLLGKIIFFITGSVAIVLFPTIVQRQANNEKHDHILKYSVLLVLAASLSITGIYFLAPGFIVALLFGRQYLPIVPYLGYFGLMMTVFSLINLLVTYNLSLRRTKFIPILLAGLILEIGLIYFYHASIWQVVDSMLGSMILILAGIILVHKVHKVESLSSP